MIGFVDRTFNTIAERQGRVIGGLSMGGYGAIKLALKTKRLPLTPSDEVVRDDRVVNSYLGTAGTAIARSGTTTEI